MTFKKFRGGVYHYTSKEGNQALVINNGGSFTGADTISSYGISVQGTLAATTILVNPSKHFSISSGATVTATNIGSAEEQVQLNQTGGSLTFDNGFFKASGVNNAFLDGKTLNISEAFNARGSEIKAKNISGAGSLSITNTTTIGSLTADSVDIDGRFRSLGTVNITGELSAGTISIDGGTTAVGTASSASYLDVMDSKLIVTSTATANIVRVKDGGSLTTQSLQGLSGGPLESVDVVGELEFKDGELSTKVLAIKDSGKINFDAQQNASVINKLSVGALYNNEKSSLTVSDLNFVGGLIWNAGNLTVDKIGSEDNVVSGAVSTLKGGTTTVLGDVYTTNGISVNGKMEVAGDTYFKGGYQEINTEGEASSFTTKNLILEGMLGVNEYDSMVGSVKIEENLTVEDKGYLLVNSNKLDLGDSLVLNDGAKVQLRNRTEGLSLKNVILNTNSDSVFQFYTDNTIENLNVNGTGNFESYADKQAPKNSKLIVNNLTLNQNSSLNFVDAATYSDRGVTSAIEIKSGSLEKGSSLSNIGNEEDGSFKNLQIGSLKADSANIINGANSNIAISSLDGQNTLLQNGENGKIKVDTLSGKDNKIVQPNLEKGQVVIGQNKSVDLKVTTTQPGFVDSIDGNNIQAGLQTLADTVLIASPEQSNSFIVEAGEGSVLGTLIGVADNHGNITKVTEEENTVSRSIVDIAGSNYLFFRSSINDVSARLGDLRSMPRTAGLWARYYGGKEKDSSRGLSEKYNTLQIGADKFIGDNFYLGAAFSYTKGDGTLRNGSSDDKNFNFGVYGGWLGEKGQYVDIIFKAHRIKTDFNLANNVGIHSSSFHTWGTSLSAETGWRFQCPTTGFYAEPQAELMLGRVNSVNYTTNQGVSAKQDSINSVIGRAGLAVGYTLPNDKGNVYAKASVLHDWKGKVKAEFTAGPNSRELKDDLGGTWGEFAVGGTYNPTKNISAYTQVKTSTGSPVRNPWQVSIGMRYSF